MTTPQWAPGTLYQPGDIVRPLTTAPTTPDPPTNQSFESGDTGWGLTHTGFLIINAGSGAYAGSWCARFTAASGTLLNDNIVPVTPGQVINASGYVQVGGPSGNLGGDINIEWYSDALGASLIATDTGNVIQASTHARGVWYQSSVTGTCPAGAAYARLTFAGFRVSGTAEVFFDAAVWDYTFAEPGDSDGQVYLATQAAAGFSGVTEPVWPTSGNTVVDNEVTWEGADASRVTWTTHPILKSGATEPVWPTVVGASVLNGTISFRATSGRIDDVKCPNTKVVAIAASKIFAGDDDIVAFSATVNPLDWSSANDAGYIPFGLNTHGSTPVTAMGLYRSNLVIFNDEGYQMWQVDQDPANMAILDASPIDCPYFRSVQPVSNDLILLTARGIRSIGIAGASTNVQAGFFGAAVDPLIIEAINALPVDEQPISLFWPGAGQYWLIFGAEAFVCTMNGGAKDASWSRYVFPDEITDWAILDTQLYLRAGNLVWRVSENALYDDQLEDTEQGGTNTEFQGYIAWQYLDFGQLGADKQMEGFDLVIDGTVGVQFGYNQRDMSQVTEAYHLDGDTLPGVGMVPMPITAPSFQFRLTFDAAQAWEWQAANLYVNDV